MPLDDVCLEAETVLASFSHDMERLSALCIKGVLPPKQEYHACLALSRYAILFEGYHAQLQEQLDECRDEVGQLSQKRQTSIQEYTGMNEANPRARGGKRGYVTRLTNQLRKAHNTYVYTSSLLGRLYLHLDIAYKTQLVVASARQASLAPVFRESFAQAKKGIKNMTAFS